MSDNPKDLDPKLKDQKNPDNEVGYGNPPKATRWVKGQSGNPNGSSKKRRQTKPKPSSSVSDIVIADSDRIVKMREGDRAIEVTMIEAVNRSLAILALKGNRIAATNYLDRADRAKREKVEKEMEEYVKATEYVDTKRLEIEECKKLGKPPPDTVPHPDDFKFDHRARTVHIDGPWTRDEKKQYDKLEKLRDELLIVIQQYSDNPLPLRESDLAHVEKLKATFEMITTALPERLRKPLPLVKQKKTGSRNRFDLG